MSSLVLKRLDGIIENIFNDPSASSAGLGYTGLWRQGVKSVLTEQASCRLPVTRADKHRERLGRILQCDPIAAQTATRLQRCAVAPCGAALCPLCTTVIDPYLVGWSGHVIKEAAHPWLVLWMYNPPEHEEAGLAMLHPDTVHEALAGHLHAAGVFDQGWLGRMNLQADLRVPARGRLCYTVVVGAVTETPTAFNLEDRLRTRPGPDPWLHLMRATPLSKADEYARAQALITLDGVFDGSADKLINEAAGIGGGPAGRGERRQRRHLVERAEVTMARYWGHVDYGDLLIGEAAYQAQEILCSKAHAMH